LHKVTKSAGLREHQLQKYIFISLKIFELDDYRSTKVNIFKLFLDDSLKM